VVPVKRAPRSVRRPIVLIASATAFLFWFLTEIEDLPGTTNTGNPPATLAAGSSEDLCTRSEAPGPPAQADAMSPIGGELPPVRYVVDPYATFNGIAVDAGNNLVIMSDENRKSVLTYDRAKGSRSSAITPPLRQIIGPQTQVGYISGVELDPSRREIYIVNNDIEDRIVVFDYDSNGDLKPKRRLYVPHQTWGISLNPSQDQVAVSVQQLDLVAFYRREASNLEAPLRIIGGPHTGLADPHGLRWNAGHHEIVIANHGNYSVIPAYSAYDAATTDTSISAGGQFRPPSLTVFADSATGDAKPLRTIQGSRTQLNWPMGIDIDTTRDEIAVANNGDNSVLVFQRTAEGDVTPARIIRGGRTGISSPMGVGIDTKNDELWVANYGDHTALVFSREAAGDAAPKRIIRNAPAGTPTGGFGNPYAVAYDSKRDELLVPN
jgi:DNA-binding beta-propeller fold protein YncE